MDKEKYFQDSLKATTPISLNNPLELSVCEHTGLEKSGRLVAICDQKIFLATRSWAAVVNLATNFSTKVPVWRPQFYARLRTNGTVMATGKRTTGFRKRNSKF